MIVDEHLLLLHELGGGGVQLAGLGGPILQGRVREEDRVLVRLDAILVLLLGAGQIGRSVGVQLSEVGG